MLVFLAVMVSDIILLDAFNSMGMPTSTTVSLVFELLGATFAFSLIKMMGSEAEMNFSDYMNTSKALSVIIAIFVSVAIAFVVGVCVQWLTRMIFTFSYKKKLKWKIGIFGGIAITAIVYFMLIKGVKSMSFMTPEIKDWIAENTIYIILISFAFFSVLMQIFHAFKINVFKVIVLVGTFALATAFAGNDLVNFVGVPLTGYASYLDWKNGGATDPESFMMGSLNEPASTPFIFLFLAGCIMVIALATSKKAHKVSKTELNLAKQDEGEEMFGSSKVARSLVRFANTTARFVLTITPQSVRTWVDKRFDKSYMEMEDGAQYDLIRASVNLVVASLLIALGTSLKLPLSTTYVTFMVAMATSLADRAWGRESAVYRITGVLSVIGGWFITAGIAFTSAFILALIMHWGGNIAVVVIIISGLAALIHSNLKFKLQKEEEKHDKVFRAIIKLDNQISCQSTTNLDQRQDRDIYEQMSGLVCDYISINERFLLERVCRYYTNITDGMMTENVKILRKAYYDLKDDKSRLKNVRRKNTICVRKLDQDTAMRKSAWFFSSFNELEILYYSIRRICEPVYEHIDNHFTSLPTKYINDFMPERDKLVAIMREIIGHIDAMNYVSLKDYEIRLKAMRKDFSNMRKALIEDIRNNTLSMNVGYLYLNVLQESEQMSIILKQMVRSSRKFQIS